MENGVIKLSPRLQIAADMVREGSNVADIGTDHAFLPVYLILCGKCGKAVAADVKKGPLMHAGETVGQYELSDKISLRLSDGLDNVNENEADDIVIAGMGGILISKIISRAEWLKNGNKQLILQPMTHSENVRKYLCENGYSIIRERAVREDNHLYCIINAKYTGSVQHKNDVYYYVGELPGCGDNAANEFILKQAKRIGKHADGLSKKSEKPSEISYLRKLSEDIRSSIE